MLVRCSATTRGSFRLRAAPRVEGPVSLAPLPSLRREQWGTRGSNPPRSIGFLKYDQNPRGVLWRQGPFIAGPEIFARAVRRDDTIEGEKMADDPNSDHAPWPNPCFNGPIRPFAPSMATAMAGRPHRRRAANREPLPRFRMMQVCRTERGS